MQAWWMLPVLLLQVKSPSHCFHLHQCLLCQQLGLLAFTAWNPGPPTPSSQGLSTLALLLEPSAECPEREEQRPRNSRRGSGRVNTGQMLHSAFVQRPSLLKQRFPFGKHKTRCARAQELPLCSRTQGQVGERSHCRASFWGGILKFAFAICHTQVGHRMHRHSLSRARSPVFSLSTRSSTSWFFPQDIRLLRLLTGPAGCQPPRADAKQGHPAGA